MPMHCQWPRTPDHPWHSVTPSSFPRKPSPLPQHATAPATARNKQPRYIHRPGHTPAASSQHANTSLLCAPTPSRLARACNQRTRPVTCSHASDLHQIAQVTCNTPPPCCLSAYRAHLCAWPSSFLHGPPCSSQLAVKALPTAATLMPLHASTVVDFPTCTNWSE